MTVSAPEESPKPRFVEYFAGTVVGAWLGAGVTCCVAALVLQDWLLLGVGAGLFAANIVFVVVSTLISSRGQEKPVPPEPVLALARIESRRAVSSEMADIPVEFVLTVAPDDDRAYRVKIRQDINLVDIPDYKPRGTIVVRYRPDRPWDVTIVTEPDGRWADRAASEAIDSAPEATLAEAPKEAVEGRSCLIAFVGLLIGAALVVFVLRGDLFDDDEAAGRPPTNTSTPSSGSWSSSSSSVKITGEVMLLPGEMRRAAEELIALAGTDQAVAFTIDEAYMTLEAPKPSDQRLVDGFEFRDNEARTEGPSGTRSTDDEPLIDLRALPYERLPELVAEAKTTLGLTAPTGWHIGFDRDSTTGALEIRVSVQDDYGSASLTADARGTVTDRSPR